MSTRATIPSIAALALAVVASPAAPAPVWIRFDDLADGTRVDQQYAAQGVRFVNDYAPDRPFRSSPQITAYAWARSAPQVLVNRAQDDEIYSSAGVPLVLHFAAPISGVGMQLGCVGPCGTLTDATVRLFDCKGQLRAQGQALPRTDFLTPLQVLDPSGQTRLVVIDYAGSLTPEAIDDLAFQPSGLACAETAPPMVQVTSHQDQQVVAGAAINLRGRVNDNSGFIAQVKINGMIVPGRRRAHKPTSRQSMNLTGRSRCSQAPIPSRSSPGMATAIRAAPISPCTTVLPPRCNWPSSTSPSGASCRATPPRLGPTAPGSAIPRAIHLAGPSRSYQVNFRITEVTDEHAPAQSHIRPHCWITR